MIKHSYNYIQSNESKTVSYYLDIPVSTITYQYHLYEVYFNEYFYIPKTYVDLATPDSVFVAANSSNLTIKFSPSTLSSNIKYYGLTVLINYESNISNQQRQYDTIFEIKPFID